MNVTTIHACCECFRNAPNCSRVASATIQGCLSREDSGWHFGCKRRHSQIFRSYHRVNLWWCVSWIHNSRCLWLKVLYCIRLCYVSLYNLDMHTLTHFSLNVKLLCTETQHGSCLASVTSMYMSTHPNKSYSHVVDAQFLCPINDFIFIVLTGDTLTSATALPIACVSCLQ